MDLFKEYSKIMNEHMLLCSFIAGDYEKSLDLLSKCKFDLSDEQINIIIQKVTNKINMYNIKKEIERRKK